MKEQVPEEGEVLITVQAEEDLVPQVLAEAAGQDHTGTVPAHASTAYKMIWDLHL
jgi:hypothetical protein